MLTQERLKECFNYNPTSGVFTRTKTYTPRARCGDIVGTHDKEGYLTVSGKD